MQMVDLKSQYHRIKTEIDEAVLHVLEHAQFINGPEVREFQQALERYLDIPHVIPCANGTDALQIALMALDCKPGDEIIVPAFTYVATAEVIALLQLRPVMIDVDYDSFNCTPELIRQAITPKTKAIVPVHLFGQVAEMQGILDLAGKLHIPVIEDNAQAIGADYVFADGKKQKAGTLGHIGCTSFFPSKNLGCYGDGGAMMCRDEALAEKLRTIANHGQRKRYYHDLIGVNSRLDSIQAAVLRIKLGHLDEYCRARQNVAYAYNEGFKDIPFLCTPAESPHSTHVYHQYTLKVVDGRRDALASFLTAEGIPNMIYYPVPLYDQEAFKPFRGKVDFLPVTDRLCKEVISLPIHTEMKAHDQEKVIDTVRRFFIDTE
ncbi:MAG TPA: DegT/DnrJ/EryC1/StrS family aminotransferase [Saprospiraceae bacterium]|nr:DegT/DnrJ/EryC1/StrS family aminotransferase [Saprospiraceae bacterium]HNT19424.1 DegT/DnrJ/EryC1/StrS family aminotransferase [Saprospiraceae bacterium]